MVRRRDDEEEEEPGNKRRRLDSVNASVEEEDDSEDELDDDDDDDDDDVEEKEKEKEGGCGGRKKKSIFIDDEAVVDEDEEEDSGEEVEENDFIVHEGEDDLPDEEDDDLRVRRREHGRARLPNYDSDEEEEIEAIARRLEEKYGKAREYEGYGEETEVGRQALLPSAQDPKLWMVKCAIGREKEVAVCLMQKAIDKGPEDVKIKSVIALDYLENYVYIEADKLSHVREAIKGMANIYSSAKMMLVPIKEMTDVLPVEGKPPVNLMDSWVRIKEGSYKGDLARVVDVDSVRRRITLKLVPRVDLRAILYKQDGIEVEKKKKGFIQPQRFMNIDEARGMGIRVLSWKSRRSGEYFAIVGGMRFKDGFLCKSYSIRSIRTEKITPTLAELELFRKHGSENGDEDATSLAAHFENRKRENRFLKGDKVIVFKGDMKNLKGLVQKAENNIVHIKPLEQMGLPASLAVRDKEICKFFEIGTTVKVVAGAKEGATGMVASASGDLLNIISDSTKKILSVFADNVVETSKASEGIIGLGGYELHDLVLLNDTSFGVIIRVDNELHAFQVLKGVSESAEVAMVTQGQIKSKLDNRKNFPARDQNGSQLAVKDVVRVVEGPCEGKQGLVEHIYRGALFVYDKHHLKHDGFICVNSRSCRLVGDRTRSNANFVDRNVGSLPSRFARPGVPPGAPMSPARSQQMNSGFGGRNHHQFRRGYEGGGRDKLVGSRVKIRHGNHKGCFGIVKDVKGNLVRVELESQMSIVTVNRDQIMDNSDDYISGLGSQTPMRPPQTPLRPFMTPSRDPGSTAPVPYGMRTPVRDGAWNPYTPMTPLRDPGSTRIPYGTRTPVRDRAWNPYTPMTPIRDPGSSWNQYDQTESSQRS